MKHFSRWRNDYILSVVFSVCFTPKFRIRNNCMKHNHLKISFC